jgi:hypothetical protein
VSGAKFLHARRIERAISRKVSSLSELIVCCIMKRCSLAILIMMRNRVCDDYLLIMSSD